MKAVVDTNILVRAVTKPDGEPPGRPDDASREQPCLASLWLFVGHGGRSAGRHRIGRATVVRINPTVDEAGNNEHRSSPFAASFMQNRGLEGGQVLVRWWGSVALPGERPRARPLEVEAAGQDQRAH